MWKFLALVVAVALTLSLASGLAFAAKPGTDFSGPHYNLNIIGKKADWNGGGSYDNPDRHTMFVPEDTTGYFDTAGNGSLAGITIWMTQGPEFAMIDGNAFDDGECAFELGPGKYKVYITAKAKPGDDRYTDITGWVRAEDDTGTYYFFDIGDVRVTKSKNWQDATDLFYVSGSEDPYGIVTAPGDGQWVFEYLDSLELAELDPDIVDALYFWQFDNHGNKLVKVRFYPS